jgi:hypothetical protein
MTTFTRLRAPEHVHWRRFDSELVVLDLRGREYFGLNDVAADAFEKLAQGRPSHDVVGELLLVYAVGRGQLEGDIEALITNLVARGLLVNDGAA